MIPQIRTYMKLKVRIWTGLLVADARLSGGYWYVRTGDTWLKLSDVLKHKHLTARGVYIGLRRD